MSLEDNSEISALKRQVFTLLLALIVVSGTLTVYLYRQASITGKDIDAIKPQAQQIIGTFNKDQKLYALFDKKEGLVGKGHQYFTLTELYKLYLQFKTIIK